MKTLQQIINIKSLFAILFVVAISTNAAFATSNNPTTNAATSIATADATLNATNGGGAADQTSFWISPSSFVTPAFPGSAIPVGVYSTPVLGAVAASGTFSSPASVVTTSGIPSNMPALTPNTTYYYVAWAHVGSDWYPGAVTSFTTDGLSQTINFPQPADVTYGDADFTVAATSTSGLTVSVTSATTGVCTVSGFTIHIVSAGICTINADQAGAVGSYSAAPTVARSFTVSRKTISVSAGDFAAATKVYDATTNALLNAVPTGVTFSGVVGADVVNIDGTSASGVLSNRNVSSTSTVTFSGYVLGGANAGNYNLSAQPANEIQAVTAKPITVTPNTDTKVYDGNTSSSVLPSPSVPVAGGDIRNFTQSFATSGVGTNKTMLAAGNVIDGNGGLNYDVTFATSSNGTITSQSLSVTAVTANNKVYDGTLGATTSGVPTLVGLVPGDAGNVILGGSMISSFLTKDVANGKTVTVTGLTITGTSSANYTLSQPTLSADITQKDLTISGLSAGNKIYDQNTVATITGSPVLNGGVSADSLPAALSLSGSAVGSFLDKNVGAAKLVNISGFSITGTAIGNYNLVAPTSTATITPAVLTVTVSGINKVYDGNTSASVTYSDDRIAGDTLVAAGTANFDNKTASTSKLVTVTGITISTGDAGNYSLFSTTATTTADITKKDMTATAVSSSKVYDATVTASTTISSADKVVGDVVTYNRTSSNFSDKNVGVAKTVTTGGITISNTDAANYNLLNSTTTSTADITARALVVTPTAVNKVYDANTTAAISALTSDVISGDTIGTLGSASANFIDKNVGTSKLVTVNVVITAGADNANYSVPATATTTADITKRTLTVSATGINKVYDGNTGATVNFIDNRLGSDVFTIASTSATFDTKNVGTAKLVTVIGLSLSGTDSGNYNVTPNSATTTADITTKSATITAENKTKVYGTVDPALTATSTGLVSPDTLTGSLTRVAGENVGTYDITAGTITAGSNYATTFATGTLTITKADQTITISPVADKNPEDAAFDVTATTTSGLDITFSLGMGPNVCTLATSTVTLTGSLGVCNIVADQAGDANYNATSSLLTINVIDTHPPVITLNGDAVINLFVGNTYNELGATAVDFVSGTTTAVVSGDVVNTNLAGTYVVRYNATDTAGNIAVEKTRSVVVANNGGIIFTSGGGSGGSFGGLIPTNSNTGGSNNGGSVLGASKFKFTKNLSFGMKKNNDVKELQKVLAALGLYKASTTGNFDKATLDAVKAYQKANNIKPVSGYFGPLTRAAINK